MFNVDEHSRTARASPLGDSSFAGAVHAFTGTCSLYHPRNPQPFFFPTTFHRKA
jgi:hypothetical protein